MAPGGAHRKGARPWAWGPWRQKDTLTRRLSLTRQGPHKHAEHTGSSWGAAHSLVVVGAPGAEAEVEAEAGAPGQTTAMSTFRSYGAWRGCVMTQVQPGDRAPLNPSQRYLSFSFMLELLKSLS